MLVCQRMYIRILENSLTDLQLPRVLYTRMVHCRQKADMSLLQREG